MPKRGLRPPVFPAVAALFLCLSGGAGAVESNRTIWVTASRLDDLDLMDVSAAADTTRIDREAIDRSGAGSVPELLQREANVLVRSTGGGGRDGQISMRGFGDNSHLRVLVLVDGHKANRPDMAGIDWSAVPLSNVEEIEVIRGGQNVLYGDAALAGVVKIKTRRGADTGLQVSGSLGGDHYRSGSVYYGDAVSDFDFLAGVDGYRYEGFRENALSHANTLSGSLGWFLSDSDTLTWRVSAGEAYQQFPGPLTYEQMTDDPTQSRNGGDEFTEEWTARSTLLYETERDWGAARINFGANYCDRTPSIAGLYSENKLAGYSLEPRVRWGSEAHYLMAGTDFFYNRLKQSNFLDEHHRTETSWADIDRFSVAPYCFARHSTERGVTASVGARWEYARTDNRYVEYVRSQLLPNIGPFPNPDYKNPPDVDPDKSYSATVSKNGWAAECSLSFPVSETVESWIGYDRVYRYPTLDETASYQGYPLSDPLNSDLDPEEGDQFEAGVKWNRGGWSASATLFCLLMENEIVYDDVQHLNRNLGATRRRGGELELGWEGGVWGVSSRWNLLDARLDGGADDGNRVPLVPKAHGTLSVWVSPLPSLRLDAAARYVSDQYQGNDEANELRKIKAYALLDLSAQWALAGSTTLRVGVENLFNKTYASSAYSGGFYPGRGRFLYTGIQISY